MSTILNSTDRVTSEDVMVQGADKTFQKTLSGSTLTGKAVRVEIYNLDPFAKAGEIYATITGASTIEYTIVSEDILTKHPQYTPRKVFGLKFYVEHGDGTETMYPGKGYQTMLAGGAARQDEVSFLQGIRGEAVEAKADAISARDVATAARDTAVIAETDIITAAINGNVVNTYALLPAASAVTSGTRYMVLEDEDASAQRTIYQSNGSAWTKVFNGLGTGANLNAGVSGGVAKVLADIADLEASDGASGQQRIVSDPSRGGLFEWVNSATANTGTIFSDGGSGYWKRVGIGPLNAKWFGAIADGSTDDRAEVAAMDAVTGSNYFPAGTYRIASNITIAAETHFDQGAKLKPDSGVTVTITGAINAGRSQIFDLSASGSVALSPGAAKVVPVEWFGATGDGATDDTTAINNAAGSVDDDQAVGFTPGKVYITSGPVSFECNVEGLGAQIISSSSTVAVNVGPTSGSTNISNKTVNLPAVTSAGGGTSAGILSIWAAATIIGVRVSNIRNSEIRCPRIDGFFGGLKVEPASGFVAYNHFFPGHIFNNKRNIWITEGASGYSNQNTFYNGLPDHTASLGTGVTGCYHLFIEDTAGSAYGAPNNNTFIGMTFETGGTVEYLMQVEGAYNQFVNCRWEAASSDIHFNGTGANHNKIIGGYNAETINVTETGAVTLRNEIDAPNRKTFQGDGTGRGFMAMNHTSSDVNAIMRMFNTSQNVHTATTQWLAEYCAGRTSYKATADTDFRLRFDHATGTILQGNGAGATTGEIGTTWGIGGAKDATIALYLRGDITTGAYQTGMSVESTLSGTSQSIAVLGSGVIKASTTVAFFAGLFAGNPTLGSGAAITDQYGVYIANQTRGTTNWGLYSVHTGHSYMAGPLHIGLATKPAAGTNYLLLGNSTELSSGVPGDSIALYQKDVSAGNTTLAVRTEGTGCYVAGTPSAATGAVATYWNGTLLYLTASTAAPV